MTSTRKSRVIRWGFRNVLTEALLFRTVDLWERTSPKSVAAAKRLGRFDLCKLIIETRHYDLVKEEMSIEHGVSLQDHLRDHPSKGRRPGKASGKFSNGRRQSWSLESIIRTALPYETFKAWAAKENKAYLAAKRRGLIYIVAKLLGGNREITRRSARDLKDEALVASALETGARNWQALQAASRSLYTELRRRVIEQGLVVPYGLPRGPSWTRKWNEAAVREVAKHATTIGMMEKRAPGSVKAAKRLGIMDEITTAYFRQTAAGARLTLSDCQSSAEGHQTFIQWLESDRQAAIRATKRGWLAETTYHMDAV